MSQLKREGIAYFNGKQLRTDSPVNPATGDVHCENCFNPLSPGNTVFDDNKAYCLSCYEFEQQIRGNEIPDTRTREDLITEVVMDDIADDRMQAHLAKIKREQRQDIHYERTHTLD